MGAAVLLQGVVAAQGETLRTRTWAAVAVGVCLKTFWQEEVVEEVVPRLWLLYLLWEEVEGVELPHSQLALLEELVAAGGQQPFLCALADRLAEDTVEEGQGAARVIAKGWLPYL